MVTTVDAPWLTLKAMLQAPWRLLSITLHAWFIGMNLFSQFRKNKFPLVIYTSRLHMLPAYNRPQLSDYIQKWLHNPTRFLNRARLMTRRV